MSCSIILVINAGHHKPAPSVLVERHSGILDSWPSIPGGGVQLYRQPKKGVERQGWHEGEASLVVHTEGAGSGLQDETTTHSQAGIGRFAINPVAAVHQDGRGVSVQALKQETQAAVTCVAAWLQERSRCNFWWLCRSLIGLFGPRWRRE